MLISSTIQIFERLVRDIPPLVPRQIADESRQALEQVRSNMHVKVDELEQTMVSVGMKLWPYREAFLEFYRVYESEVGEKALLQKLPYHIKKQYLLSREHGGSFRDLHSGCVLVGGFSSEDHVILCGALVDIQKEVWRYTVQAVLTKDRARYEKRIAEFQSIFFDIEKKLDGLRDMTQKEGEHPELVQEMKEHIRGFEQGLCLLGPKLDYEALCNSEDHFEARRGFRKIMQRT